MTAPSSASTETDRALRRLVAARRRGDAEGSMEAWRTFVILERPRIVGLVKAYRHPSLAEQRVAPADVDDVVQQVFERLRDFVLKGSSTGEARTIVNKATGWECLDYVRAHVQDQKHRAGSIDAPAPDGGQGRIDRELGSVGAELQRRQSEAEDSRLRLEAALEHVDENKREVLRLELQNYSADEIGRRLGLSRDNVYQRQRRGREQLRRQLEGDE